jgi:hypothetical protein
VNLLIYAIVGVVVVIGAYRLVWGRKLDGDRDALLAQRNAAKVTVGKEWDVLRERLEATTLEAAKLPPSAPDFVSPELANWNFRDRPGVYLRLRHASAGSSEAIRRAAPYSVKDAFTGCLLRESTKADNRADAGPFAEQPWNLKQAYQSTRVLTEDWEAEVRAAGDDMRLRVFQDQYERAKRDEIPLVVDILKRAEFYLLVLDEDVPEAKASTDAGLSTEDLMMVRHPTRIWLHDVKRNVPMAKLRLTAEERGFQFATGGAQVSQETREAMTRQVNNCGLAQEVKAKLDLKN